MRPIILLTCTRLTSDSRWPAPASARTDCQPTELPAACEADTSIGTRNGLLMSYARSVVLAGGAPVLLPNVPDDDAIAAAIEAAGGLLLTGGGDVDGALYGRGNHPTMSNIDHDRDQTETIAIRLAMKHRLPILGICRGIQVMNVALGGTLIQDIPSTDGKSAAAEVNHVADHAVRLTGGSELSSLWGATAMTVNSSHHQAADQIGSSLKPIAWAPDGVVEALESADGYPLLAVQCHPERLAHKSREFLAVFRWLVDRAGKIT
jgi:putative glutamine amidotransferase